MENIIQSARQAAGGVLSRVDANYISETVAAGRNLSGRFLGDATAVCGDNIIKAGSLINQTMSDKGVRLGAPAISGIAPHVSDAFSNVGLAAGGFLNQTSRDIASRVTAEDVCVAKDMVIGFARSHPSLTSTLAITAISFMMPNGGAALPFLKAFGFLSAGPAPGTWLLYPHYYGVVPGE